MSAQTHHDKMLDQIIREAHVLGIDGVIWAEKEVPVTVPNGTRLLTAIDVLIFNGQYHCIEYKGSGRSFTKAGHQLDLAAHYVREHYGENPTCYFVHGDDMVFEIVTPER